MQPMRALITSLAHDGRGVTHVDGKAVFVDGALPGETVMFTYTDIRRDYAEGRAESVIDASDDRVEPRCRHYGVCGGCSIQHLASEAQIRVKQTLLAEQFARIGKLESVSLWPPLTGPYWRYRRKARLGVKFVQKKGRVLVGFREKRAPFVADLERCEILHPSIGERLIDLAEVIGALTVKEKLPQVEVAVGDHRCALVFRVLEAPTEEDREKLRRFGSTYGFDMYLQPGGPDSLVPLGPDEPSPLKYALPEFDVEFSFTPTVFTQVNTEINRKTVDRVIELLAPEPEDDILDLFCGLGNFTLPLARRAGAVVGIEGSADLVTLARENARRNGIINANFYTADLARDLDDEAWTQRRYGKILLDPSRAGAQEVMAHIPRWEAKRICYVSCNPSTLARDADILVHQLGYRIVGAGAMDMFPQTSHVESIALFEK